MGNNFINARVTGVTAPPGQIPAIDMEEQVLREIYQFPSHNHDTERVRSLWVCIPPRSIRQFKTLLKSEERHADLALNYTNNFHLFLTDRGRKDFDDFLETPILEAALEPEMIDQLKPPVGAGLRAQKVSGFLKVVDETITELTSKGAITVGDRVVRDLSDYRKTINEASSEGKKDIRALSLLILPVYLKLREKGYPQELLKF